MTITGDHDNDHNEQLGKNVYKHINQSHGQLSLNLLRHPGLRLRDPLDLLGRPTTSRSGGRYKVMKNSTVPVLLNLTMLVLVAIFVDAILSLLLFLPDALQPDGSAWMLATHDNHKTRDT